jgi:hypothetical protein
MLSAWLNGNDDAIRRGVVGRVELLGNNSYDLRKAAPWRREVTTRFGRRSG